VRQTMLGGVKGMRGIAYSAVRSGGGVGVVCGGEVEGLTNSLFPRSAPAASRILA
jgi:hypothetical protein